MAPAIAPCRLLHTRLVVKNESQLKAGERDLDDCRAVASSWHSGASIVTRSLGGVAAASVVRDLLRPVTRRLDMANYSRRAADHVQRASTAERTRSVNDKDDSGIWMRQGS
jgi:hypothetical protein